MSNALVSHVVDQYSNTIVVIHNAGVRRVDGFIGQNVTGPHGTSTKLVQVCVNIRQA